MAFQGCRNNVLRYIAYFAALVELFFIQAQVVRIGLPNKVNDILAFHRPVEKNDLFLYLIAAILVDESVAQIGLLYVLRDVQIFLPKLFFTPASLFNVGQQNNRALGKFNQCFTLVANFLPGGHADRPIKY